MHDAVIGLGSNLGSRCALLEAALLLLEATPGMRVLSRSKLYRTAPMGPPQPDYLNAAARVRWVGSAQGLLATLLFVEARLGRQRQARWGPRTLDLDLLWWSAGPVHTPRLQVPHPGLTERSFALAPLLDVAPELAPRYAAALAAAGGVPETRAWSAGDAPGERHLDAADAVACAARWVAHTRGSGASAQRGSPWATLPWDPTPEGGRLDRALWALDWAARLGVVVQHAAVLVTGPGRWRGLLLGRSAETSQLVSPHLPRLQLEPGGAAGEVGLSLLTQICLDFDNPG